MDATATLERRDVLKAAGVGALAIGVAGTVFADRADAAGLATHLSDDGLLHLLRRATFGPTRASVAQIRTMGRAAWLEQQLHPAGIDDTACADLVARLPQLQISMADKYASQDFGWDLMFALGQSTIIRAAWSKRQLLEVMVDFWSNHLNVANPGDHGWYNRHDYDRTVIRRHALGRFEDMLVASARHPSMLLYLNNASSTKQAPNENYGRELLELHTVGLEAGYSELEMRTSALIMTGFTIDWDTGLYRYEPEYHHTGAVKILGFQRSNAAADGEALAVDYLRYLANRRSTAEHIATKLATRFVRDDPPAGLVDTLADVYLANGTAIVPVLRALFTSAAFKGSIGEKVRRPYEDVIATIRALRIKADATGTEGIEQLYWVTEGLGQAPLGWVPPNGYPDTTDAWRSAGSSLGRWNMHMGIAAGWWPNTLRRPRLSAYFPSPLPPTYGALVQQVAQNVLAVRLPTAQRDAICGFFDHAAGDALGVDDEIVGWRRSHLVSLVLDTPTHFLR